MKRINLVAICRAQLGMSQQTFAEYLGLSRGTLSLIELGERDLPFSALSKLSDLMQVIEQAKPIVLPDALLLQAKENLRLALQKELDELRYQLLKQSRELEKLEQDDALAEVRMQFSEYIRQNPTALKADEKMQAILHSQAKQSLKNWQTNLQALCFLKKTAIESLQHQAQKIEEKLGSL